MTHYAHLQYVVKEIALYPNSVSVPLMENFGVPHAPKGMIHVKLERITNLKSTDFITKGDPYVVFEVSAAGRTYTTLGAHASAGVTKSTLFTLADYTSLCSMHACHDARVRTCHSDQHMLASAER